jgi:hypothetical protein
MVGNQRKIRIAGGDERDGDDVDPKDRYLLIRTAAGRNRRMKTCRIAFPEARRNSPAPPSREIALCHTARASESGAIPHRCA